MSDEIRMLSRRRTATDVVATVFGITALFGFVFLGERTAFVVGTYGLLLGTSTAVVTYCLTRFTGITVHGTDDENAEREDRANDSRPLRDEAWRIFTGRALESDADVEEDTGWLIGRIENVLVLTLVFAGQYTALSIIFAAKSWVRREDTSSENTTYYLAGTLVNFTYSIIVGVGAVRVLDLI